MLCDVERFDIQYNLANDDERFSSQRYYSDIYGNDMSDTAIREHMIFKLKKLSLSGDNKDYDSFIAKKHETYKTWCLYPANWYEPIPEKIWSDIIQLKYRRMK